MSKACGPLPGPGGARVLGQRTHRRGGRDTDGTQAGVSRGPVTLAPRPRRPPHTQQPPALCPQHGHLPTETAAACPPREPTARRRALGPTSESRFLMRGAAGYTGAATRPPWPVRAAGWTAHRTKGGRPDRPQTRLRFSPSGFCARPGLGGPGGLQPALCRGGLRRVTRRLPGAGDIWLVLGVSPALQQEGCVRHGGTNHVPRSRCTSPTQNGAP